MHTERIRSRITALLLTCALLGCAAPEFFAAGISSELDPAGQKQAESDDGSFANDESADDVPADGEPADDGADDATADGEPADDGADDTPTGGEPADDEPSEPSRPDYVAMYGDMTDYCDEFIGTVTLEDIQRFLNRHGGPLRLENLSDYYDLDPYDIAENATFYCDELYGAADMSPAEIIYWCTKNHNCNPVLLMTSLQNEQSLIESYSLVTKANYTIQDRLRRATGYDGPNYFGFFGQVLATSWQYRTYQTRGKNFREAYETYTPPINGVSTFYIYASIYHRYAEEMREIIATRPEPPVEPEPSDSNRIVGDLSADGRVTNLDTLLIMQFIYEGKTYTAPSDGEPDYDCDGDGKVTNADTLCILRIIAAQQDPDDPDDPGVSDGPDDSDEPDISDVPDDSDGPVSSDDPGTV